jgi:hypothetical protein
MLDGLCVADRPRIRLREELLVREFFANANSNAHTNTRARSFAIGFMEAMRR